MPKKRASRIYWRDQGGVRRAYADFRDFADVGGGREALVPEGQRQATADEDVAQSLATDRLKALEAKRRGIHILGVTKRSGLAAYASYHLVKKKQQGKTTDHELAKNEKRLQNAVTFMISRKGAADPDLASIDVEDVQAWVTHLFETLPSRPRNAAAKRGSVAPATVRHYLVALSNLYRRATSERYAVFNPVRELVDKPQPTRGEAEWLEVDEAALLLEAARLYKPRQRNYLQCAYPLLATFLLTGGREREIFGLEVRDVNFDRKTITFRPNEWRELKTTTSHRTIRLWPQLEAILREYLDGGHAPKGKLLFPAWVRRDGERCEQPITDERKMLDAVAELAGITRYLSAHMFRHTYCAARLQTLDRGHPVSPFTVGRELGHGGEALVKRVYGHLGEVRHRAEVVEYRVEQHRKALRDALKGLRARAAAQVQPS